MPHYVIYVSYVVRFSFNGVSPARDDSMVARFSCRGVKFLPDDFMVPAYAIAGATSLAPTRSRPIDRRSRVAAPDVD